ncbi:MAG: SDR family NAD(P)-dependent oxidoreductase, partial [Nannocystaceae bacterium]
YFVLTSLFETGRARAEETTLDVDRRIMELNYFAVVSLTKAVLPGMVARNTGHLVVVSSVAGYVGTKRRTAYAATKHAVRGYFDSLRAEVAERGVGVTIVCPGYVQTEISSSAMLGDGGTSGSTDVNIARGIPADQAARAILRGVLRGQHEVYVGGKEIAAIYLKRFFPRLLARIVRKMPEV